MVFTQIWYLHKQGLQDQNLPSNDEITRFDGTYLAALVRKEEVIQSCALQ